MSARRRAPKRLVMQVRRVGTYPGVQWKHWLECGHVEARKRKAPAERIGCTTCLNRTTDEVEVMPDLERERVTVEAKLDGMMGEIVNKLGLRVDNVHVEVQGVDGQAQVTGATIRLVS